MQSGQYEVVRELNRGGTAIVYEAFDTKRQGSVALKVINVDQQIRGDATSAKLKHAVQREIASAASFNHPHVVKLLDVFQQDSTLVLVWELVQGQDLLDLLNAVHGTMSHAAIAFYFQQLVRAVQFMHDHGFCHRDIKAENCMVDVKTHMLKVIDFGLSKHLDSAQTLGVGTPDYMPPELLVQSTASRPLLNSAPGSRHAYNARAVDVWSCGVVLYLLCTGRYPFEDPLQPRNVKVTLQNILAMRAQPLPSTLPAALSELIFGMIRLNPDERMSLEAILSNTWLRCETLRFAQALHNKRGSYPYDLLPDAWLPSNGPPQGFVIPQHLPRESGATHSMRPSVDEVPQAAPSYHQQAASQGNNSKFSTPFKVDAAHQLPTTAQFATLAAAEDARTDTVERRTSSGDASQGRSNRRPPRAPLSHAAGGASMRMSRLSPSVRNGTRSQPASNHSSLSPARDVTRAGTTTERSDMRACEGIRDCATGRQAPAQGTQEQGDQRRLEGLGSQSSSMDTDGEVPTSRPPPETSANHVDGPGSLSNAGWPAATSQNRGRMHAFSRIFWRNS